MHQEHLPDRGLAICEIAAILAMLSSVSLISDHAAAQDTNGGVAATQQPLTYELVHGDKRISLGGPSPAQITWLDDDRYLQRKSDGWKVTQAATGEESDWYDKGKLAISLQKIEGVSSAEAQAMAEGSWLEVDQKNEIVVFRSGDRLIRIRLDGTESAVVNGVSSGIELTTLSPTGSGLAFVRQNELWVADFTAETLRQLTHDAGEHVRNGKADWVYFEEIYNRKWQAYRWSPDGESLAYQQFDDSEVPTFQISDHTTVTQSVEVEHYPKAGDKNPLVRLGIVSRKGGATTWIDTSTYESHDLILTHFQWKSDSSGLYWYAQNRIQTWLDIVYSELSGESRRILRDQTEAWIENPGDLHFLADGSFLLFRERSGWKHLYRVSADGLKQTPLTAGEWEARELLSVNEAEKTALVTGTRDSRIAEKLYQISLSGKSTETVKLTSEFGHHTVTVSPLGKHFIDTWSNLHQPPTVELRDANGDRIRVLQNAATIPTDKYRFGKLELREVPMADGSTTSAIFILPPDFDSAKKYPIWLKTYAGPHSPGVKDVWNPRLPEHLLANLDIVVIIFDPRSASGYGARSAWLAYRQLGVEETKDLVTLCRWLRTESWVDGDRIGLSGHSYGGFFTAYAMTHCNDICAGISGAPVTDWANYDTIYTERFMSTPQLNPEGYKKSSVIEAASSLNGHLLLLHGLKDDNVHPENTIQLVHALQQADKQFDLMLYPTARHGIYGAHYNKLLFNFIVEAMGRPDARQD
jgi:dipeptidyl-peptidase-4